MHGNQYPFPFTVTRRYFSQRSHGRSVCKNVRIFAVARYTSVAFSPGHVMVRVLSPIASGSHPQLPAPTASITSTIDLLSSRQHASVHRVPRVVPQSLEEFEPEEILTDDTLQQEISEAKPDKRRKFENTRVQQLRSDPKKVRSESRSNLQPGYCVSTSGKKDTLILRRVGACFRVPGIDYPKFFRYLGGCRQRADSSRCVVSARKQGLWTKVKEVRVRLRARRLQTKIDWTGEKA